MMIVLLIILVVSGSFEKILYKIIPEIYGSFYRGGMVWNPEFKGEFKTYTSEKIGVQISYPDSWLVKDILEPKGGITPIATLGEMIYSKNPDNHYPNNMAVVYEDLTPAEVSR